MIGAVSDWFWQYGFTDARDDVLFGAYPLDAGDVAMIARLGVKRVLNLAEDVEYAEGSATKSSARWPTPGSPRRG